MADDSSTEKLRLFLAIPMPETVRNEITGVQRELRRLVSHDAIRWTKPEQFHLTLRFLGDVPAERVAALQEAVNSVCRASPALHLRAQGTGFFGPVSTTAKGAWRICRKRLKARFSRSRRNRERNDLQAM
jgi:2'-5' RNA ligase